MIKNGQYYVAPQNDGSNFKQLFARLMAEGAGRPVDSDGVPDGSWTPELLTNSICAIDENQAGIELRTVQFWFQVSDNSIGTDNIRWLARIFGCNDPDATSQWQTRLLIYVNLEGRSVARLRCANSQTLLGFLILWENGEIAPLWLKESGANISLEWFPGEFREEFDLSFLLLG